MNPPRLSCRHDGTPDKLPEFYEFDDARRPENARSRCASFPAHAEEQQSGPSPLRARGGEASAGRFAEG